MTQLVNKPELLLPVGNTESFYAAIAGGADSVYLGLRKFNARGRAKNFAVNQLQSILKEAGQNGLKVYLTLNTLIRNSELNELLDTLYLLSQTTVSAVIIQDWGVYYFLKKYFPKLKLHASTQMKVHNSTGTDYLSELGFERIIPARELTFRELKKIKSRTPVELEIFGHGALCYSFSGMCLFSSYFGGMSANRGLCKQPCRRLYDHPGGSDYIFSLKDLQMIELIPQLSRLGISAIKIEGRMKSAEYVFRVARAYRMVIDDAQKIPEAKELLKSDMGREKMTYFLGGDVSNAITKIPFLGIYIGSIETASKEKFSFQTLHILQLNNRIRILPRAGKDSKSIKIKEFAGYKKSIAAGEMVTIRKQNEFGIGDKVFLVGLSLEKFGQKFRLSGKRLKLSLSAREKNNILAGTGSAKRLKREELYIRIDSLPWLKKIYLENIDFLILNFRKKEWEKLDLQTRFIQKNRRKFIIEFPKFIAEEEIDFYLQLAETFSKYGFAKFMLSHISQKKLFPENCRNLHLYTSENVYTLNDAAIQFLKGENIKSHVYPLENDYPNLIGGEDRDGIVPLFFFPELFYARMPIVGKEKEFPINDTENEYRKLVKDGVTVVIPQKPVSLLHYRKKLLGKGFRRFLIDFSYARPSGNFFNSIRKSYENSLPHQPSGTFNFKKGMR